MEVITSAYSEVKLPPSDAPSELKHEVIVENSVAEQHISEESKTTENETLSSDTSHSHPVIPEEPVPDMVSGFSLHRIDSKSISSQASASKAVERSASDSRVATCDMPFSLSHVDKTGDTSVEIHLLRSRCRILEQSHKELEAKNRTLEYDIDALKAENQQINTKLLSIMSAVAKLSAQTRHSATTGSGQQVATGSKMEEQRSEDQSEVKKATENQPAESAVSINERLAVLATMEGQMLTVTEKLSQNEKEITSMTSRLDAVDSKTDWLESELQRYVRRHSIIIENFCPKEDRSASEIFLLFVNSVLGVQVDDSDIDSLHLIDRTTVASGSSTKPTGAGSPEKRPRPVLVTFACYRARAQVYRAWLTFRTSSAGTTPQTSGGSLSGERGQGLCIREFLTEQQEAVYNEAHDAREKKLVSDCWTFKGKTFVRTLTGEIREFINKEQSLPRDESKYSACSVM